MAPSGPTYESIDQYIAAFAGEAQRKLKQMRRAIRSAAPAATEAIAYQIPTFKLNGKNLVHFAGYTGHIGMYPVPAGTKTFQRSIEQYRAGKGTLRFPLGEPLPLDVIKQVVELRIKETAPASKPK